MKRLHQPISDGSGWPAACSRGGEAVGKRRTWSLWSLMTKVSEPVPSRFPAESAEPKWYAVYTWAHHEKRVAEHLAQRQIRGFLPVYRSVHRWKDRRKEIELALFPSYIFVHFVLNERVRVLEIPGVVNLVGAQGKPTPLDDREIESFQRGADGCVRMEPHPFLHAGRRVRVRSGPMTGLEGVLVRRKDGLRLVVSIEILMRAVAVEIDEADVEPCW
jgi:transcription antitermination factor NusG